MMYDAAAELNRREDFLNGIRKLKQKGVAIYIDNRESPESDWPLLLREQDDSSFYMGDFIEDPSTGKLVSVHFDRVTHEIL